MQQRSKLIPALLLIVWLTSPLHSADPQSPVLRVAADGSTEYSKIQAAIDAAPAGAIVRVGPGTYAGPVIIDKPLRLEGAGADRTVLTANWVTLQEFLVEGKGVSKEDLTAFRELQKIAVDVEHGEGPVSGRLWEDFGPKPTLTVKKCKDVVVRGISLNMPGTVFKGGWKGFRMSLIDDASATIEKCALAGSAVDGMEIKGESNVVMRNFLVAGIRASGIVVNAAAAANVKIVECDIRGCGYAGVSLKGTDHVVVNHCRISNVEFHGTRYDNCSPMVTGNVFLDVRRAGIYIGGTTKGEISDNLFLDCGVGGDCAKIVNNTFVRKKGPSPQWRDVTAIAMSDQKEALIHNNVIAGYDHALVRNKPDEQPLHKDKIRFTANLCETAKSAVISCFAAKADSDYLPAPKPELLDLALPNGNWQVPIKFADVEHNNYTLSAEVTWPADQLGTPRSTARGPSSPQNAQCSIKSNWSNPNSASALSQRGFPMPTLKRG